MRFTIPSFALLALLAHVGVQAGTLFFGKQQHQGDNLLTVQPLAPLEERFPHGVRAVDPDCHTNPARDVSLYRRGSKDVEIIIEQIIEIQNKNKKKDKKKDNKRINAYKKKNKDKNTIIIVVTVIEIKIGGGGGDGKGGKGDKGKGGKGDKGKGGKDKGGKSESAKQGKGQEGGWNAGNNTAMATDAAAGNDTAVSTDAAAGNDTAASTDAAASNDTAIATDAAAGNNGTNNLVQTMYATHTLMADNGAATNEQVQIFDYQTTAVYKAMLQATGTDSAPAPTDGANNSTNILEAGSPPPSYAQIVPDPANPAVATQQ
ncbi:hypothetical protein FGG08_003580 [Glutinoglossum americanum]|uniref:Uncharacterized protein n=1 Tax=Glutinoglossum americanum TaxID=1670608 RepID=A0A9P8I3Z0_9PEZI|nr:hypothetical protein FGG08_003580 [Glutinoglossum americanum]